MVNLTIIISNKDSCEKKVGKRIVQFQILWNLISLPNSIALLIDID